MKYETTIMLKVDNNFKKIVSDQSHDERTSMSELIRRVMIDYIDNKNSAEKNR